MADILDDSLDYEEDTQKGKFLIFSLDKENYGIEIKYVTEIIGIQLITDIPDLPLYIKGVINLRGKIIPIMDVRLRFGKEPRKYDDRTCIIVVDIKDMSIGLVVDRVFEVTSVPDEDIAAPPQMNKSFQKYIKGIGKVGNEVKLLLDCDCLLDEEESEILTEAM
ncbi:MAG: chemotaxis protein CheW [Firmicutes bacterium HGW-Firmicutes-15]|nr:MAG: chemotaxis protein CheW [Firmicutes bacterium HGW-Firmicutes-15]